MVDEVIPLTPTRMLADTQRPVGERSEKVLKSRPNDAH
jgi:hypothetical protein